MVVFQNSLQNVKDSKSGWAAWQRVGWPPHPDTIYGVIPSGHCNQTPHTALMCSSVPVRQDGPHAEPAVQSLRRARGRLPLRGLHLRGLQVLLRADVQQPVRDRGVQEQLQVRGGQEEQDLVQGLQTLHSWLTRGSRCSTCNIAV